MAKNENSKIVTATYEQQWKKSKADGKTRQVSYDIGTWDEEGKVLIGRLLKVRKVDSKELGGTFEGQVNKYLFDTDEGLVSCVCGTSVDKLIDGNEDNFIGQVMAIEFQGKRQLSQGREFNVFRVDIISMSDSKDDIPF